MDRSASAIWRKGLKNGNGEISSSSGAFRSLPYSFKTRFEGDAGTNPEELIAAAHAGCFSMAFSAQLEQSGVTAEEIKTEAVVTLEKQGDGFSVTKSHLKVMAKAPEASKEMIEGAAKRAKEGCPISKLLNASITMDLTIG